ncbi:MAG: transposase [Chloroflexi bacterium]|nr:transposase [Chloroflexota bacterium]
MYEYRNLTRQQRQELVQERIARGYPPHSPPHLVRDQQFYLLTATCYEHAPHMHMPERRRQVLDSLFEMLILHGIEMCAWVILPNHYHILVHVLDFDALGTVFRQVHGATSRQWNIEEGMPGRKVWYRFSDRAIRSERHYYTTLNYIHYNPVKHHWVALPYDWAESSIHWYAEYYGREWLHDLWVSHPIRDYGRGWDER